MHDRNEPFFEQLESRTLLAAVFWDGGGGDENWFNPLNWSGDVLPGPDDDVTIDLANEEIVVRFSAGSATIASLHSEEELEILSGTLTVLGSAVSNGLVAVGGNLVIGGEWRQAGLMAIGSGEISGAGDLVTSGPVLWTGGRVAGSGDWRVLAGGSVEVTGTGTLNRRIVSEGQLYVQGLLVSSADIISKAGAMVRMTGNSRISLSGGSGLYSAGMLVAAGQLATLRGIVATWGNVEIASGGLRVYGSSWWGGSASIASGAVLEFAQDTSVSYHTFMPGLALDAAGTIELSGESAHAFTRLNLIVNAEGIEIGRLLSTYAYLHARRSMSMHEVEAGEGARFHVSETLSITGGAVLEQVVVAARPGAVSPVFRVASSGMLSLTHWNSVKVPMVNEGRIVLSMGQIWMERFENSGGAVLELIERAQVFFGAGGFHNSGAIYANALRGADVQSDDGEFFNHGFIGLSRGYLKVSAVGGGSTGEINIANFGHLLIIGSGFVLESGSAVAGAGTLRFLASHAGASPFIVRGSVATRLDLDADTRWEGGAFEGILLLVTRRLEAITDLVIPGQLLVRNGIVGSAAATGRIIVLPAGRITFDGSGGPSHRVEGVVITYGSVWFGGTLTIGAGGKLVVAHDTVFNAGSGQIHLNPGSLIMRGQFVTRPSATVRIAGEGGIAAPLFGRFVVEVGTLEIAANGRHTASFAVGQWGRLMFAEQPHRLGDSGEIIGLGTLAIRSGSLMVWGHIDIAKIEIDGSGRLIVREAVVTIAEWVNMSSGAIVLMRGALLDVPGLYEQTGGILRIHAAGAGMGDFGRISAAQAMTSGDAVMRLHLAYAPVAGEVLEFITAGVRGGEFWNAAVLNLPSPAPAWELEYLPDAVRLAFV